MVLMQNVAWKFFQAHIGIRQISNKVSHIFRQSLSVSQSLSYTLTDSECIPSAYGLLMYFSFSYLNPIGI